MNTSLTICDFLEQGGAQVSFFDMGRRVIEIPLDVMRRFEATEAPYPLPFLQSAWLGILFQYPQANAPQTNTSDQNETSTVNPHNIWFVKLALDEQGLLQQAARDDFLRHILKTLDETLTNKEQSQQPVPDDNPHGFTPREDRMAMFHAKISKLTGEAPSQYYAHAMDYFAGTAGYEQWNFVGLQGIADVAARINENNNRQTLAQAIPHLPTTPFAALCGCLENVELEKMLTQKIAVRVNEALNNNDAVLVAAGIRGLSYGTDQDTIISTIMSALESSSGRNVEVLAAIAGRAWETLKNPALRSLFLENLALCEAGQQAFNSIMTDLLFLPELRQLIKKDFRKPERSEQLAASIGKFLELVQTV